MAEQSFSAAEQELKAAFPDPAIFITIFDTIVNLISKCKNKDNIQDTVKSKSLLVKSLVRTKLRESGYKGDIVAAADKIVNMAQTSPNAKPFIQECSELSFELF